MRNALKELHGQRRTFTARFEEIRDHANYRGRSMSVVLLQNVRLDGIFVADHVWMPCTIGWQINLHAGDVVEFQARVDKYVKGYFGTKDVVKPKSEDYTLVYPRKIRILKAITRYGMAE